MSAEEGLAALVVFGIVAAAASHGPPGPAASTVGTSSTTSVSCSSTLVERSERSDCARQAQSLLKQRGYYTAAADGVFGSRSVDATIRFQRAEGIRTDGVVGPATWRALQSG